MKSKFSNAPINAFNDPNYINYVVEYQGDLVSEASLSSKYYITIINDKYAIITAKYENILENPYNFSKNPFPSIVFISRQYSYAFQGDVSIDKNNESISVSPIDAANINNVREIEPLKLTGKGTVVGLIGAGIDYLNEEFLNNDGTTRILSIWDQTIDIENLEKGVPFGQVFTEEKINEAIKASKEGRSPYDIVETKDDTGRGTAIASIIGARGVNPELIGAAPECKFVVVKLSRSIAEEKLLKSKRPLYGRSVIMLGLQYLYEYALENNVPMVINFPLGTSEGNHKVNGLLEDYIDDICNNIGIAVITCTGDQGNANNHTSGFIKNVGEYRDVDIYVSEEQKILNVQMWVDKPNVMSVGVISPSGRSTGTIPASLNQGDTDKFSLEQTFVSIDYYYPESLSGDEFINIGFYGLQPGVWKIRIYGDYIIDGNYNLWLFEKSMLFGGTRFTSPDSYGTITNPSTGRYSITVSSYNQTNLDAVSSAGVAFANQEYNPIDIVAGGVNAKVAGINNSIAFANGTAIAGAVVSGASALMFQWGIVDKNDKYMYAQTLKSYLMLGTIKRSTDNYPNPQWGYGILDLLGVFRNI